MRTVNLLRDFSICALLSNLIVNGQDRDVRINEIVVDPKQDFNMNGGISDSDEYIELFNKSSNISYNLKGWKLELIDITPESLTLNDVAISPRGFYLIQNPRGAQNNDGEIRLYDSFEKLVDRISYGDWNGENRIPDGNASGTIDQSLTRFPDGSMNWIKTYATPGFENIAVGRIKPKLFIEKINRVEKEGIELYVISFPPSSSILQKSYDLRKWENVFTNNAPEIAFTYSDFNFKSAPQTFYRAVEYVE